MTQPIPPGEEGLIPHLVVDDGAKAIDFYKKARGAEEVVRLIDGPEPPAMTPAVTAGRFRS